MKFQNAQEAETAVRQINVELQFRCHFGEMEFPARASVRRETRRGSVHYSLNAWLSTIACSVPSSCLVTHLKPTTQLGRDALSVIGSAYRRRETRKKVTPTDADSVTQAKINAFYDRMNALN